MYRQIRYGTINSGKMGEEKPLEFTVYQCQDCRSWIDHTTGGHVITLKTTPPTDLCSRCHMKRIMDNPRGIPFVKDETKASSQSPKPKKTWDKFVEEMLQDVPCVRCGKTKKRVLFERVFVTEGKGVCQSCCKQVKK